MRRSFKFRYMHVNVADQSITGLAATQGRIPYRDTGLPVMWAVSKHSVGTNCQCGGRFFVAFVVVVPPRLCMHHVQQYC